MHVTVRIPAPLRRFTDNQPVIQVSARTVEEALTELDRQYGGLGPQLYNENGELRNFVNLYVGGEDIRYLEGLKTLLQDKDEIMIIPSIAGGVDDNITFDRNESVRYSRHFSLPEIGLEGQRKLKQASVLIIGAGGLGSPASIYLAAAGVGHIGLADFDVIDLSNLQRQILYSTSEVGQHKLDAAKKHLQDLNPNVEVTQFDEALTSANAMQIFQDFDLVIDGTDNFPTRYLVNDVCVFQGKPNIYGSIFRFDGQLSVFYAKKGPCYRCLYEEPPPPGLVPSCAEGGVLGVLPGIVGSLQATEAIKCITGIGDLLIGRLLLFDALSMSFRTVKLRKNPECSVCGENPSITAPIDYEGFCGVSGLQETVSIPEVNVREVKTKMDDGEDFVILDIREPWERQIVKLDQALFIPMNSLTSRLEELDPSKEIIVHCRTGQRSASVTEYLIKHGFQKARNMAGGIRAWATEIDPSLNVY